MCENNASSLYMFFMYLFWYLLIYKPVIKLWPSFLNSWILRSESGCYWYAFFYSSASTASDYRKRRKSEPAVSHQRAPSDQNANRPNLGRTDTQGPSTTLRKPLTSSSPSSPSRAKGKSGPHLLAEDYWWCVVLYIIYYILYIGSNCLLSLGALPQGMWCEATALAFSWKTDSFMGIILSWKAGFVTRIFQLQLLVLTKENWILKRRLNSTIIYKP